MAKMKCVEIKIVNLYLSGRSWDDKAPTLADGLTAIDEHGNVWESQVTEPPNPSFIWNKAKEKD